MGQPERETVYEPDGWDNVKSITYPSGMVVSYTHDRENRVTSVSRASGDGGTVLMAAVLEHHPSGAVGRVQFANGIVESYVFDAYRYWLRQIAGGPVQLTYGYDGVGNVRSIADGRAEFNQTFTYENVDRLRWVTGWAAYEYQYDALGNRRSKSANAGPPVTARSGRWRGPLPCARRSSGGRRLALGRLWADAGDDGDAAGRARGPDPAGPDAGD